MTWVNAAIKHQFGLWQVCDVTGAVVKTPNNSDISWATPVQHRSRSQKRENFFALIRTGMRVMGCCGLTRSRVSSQSPRRHEI